MSKDNVTIDVEFLKSLMKVKNLSESEFADLIGVSHSMVNRVLNGKRGAGKKFIFGVLSAFNDVTMSQLFSNSADLPKGNKKKIKTA